MSITAAPRLLAGRRALVTGGGSGLGLIMAQALAEAGAAVLICGRRRDVVEEAARAIGEGGGDARAIVADVSRPEAIAPLREAAGDVDILVNNAGYSIRKESWLDVTADEWQEVLAVNLMAPFLLAQAFVPAMSAAGYGRVINLSSIYGVRASDPQHYPDMASDNTSYVASKHGLIGLTKNLAMRVSGSGVTVNAISPGIFPGVSRQQRTDGVKAGQLTAQKLLGEIPVGRFGEAADLGGLVTFIAGPASAYITGHTFVIDGGFTVS